MPIFYQKYVYSLKNAHCSQAHILLKKTCILQTTVLSCHFFSNFSWKTLCCQALVLSKNRQFCQNYIIFWAQKVNGRFLFSGFSRKNNCCYTHILSKNVYSLKTQYSHAHNLSKKRQFSRKHIALVSFFSKFSWKTLYCHAPVWSKKTSILSKLHYIMGEKSPKDAFFLLVFTKKSLL